MAGAITSGRGAGSGEAGRAARSTKGNIGGGERLLSRRESADNMKTQNAGANHHCRNTIALRATRRSGLRLHGRRP